MYYVQEIFASLQAQFLQYLSTLVDIFSWSWGVVHKKQKKVV